LLHGDKKEDREEEKQSLLLYLAVVPGPYRCCVAACHGRKNREEGQGE
jgi:hypothetical protein